MGKGFFYCLKKDKNLLKKKIIAKTVKKGFENLPLKNHWTRNANINIKACLYSEKFRPEVWFKVKHI